MERLILFARTPGAGPVKTRMTPPLSEDQARALHEAMLADQIRFAASLRRSSRRVELCLDAPWEDPTHDLPRTLQGDGDLGARMARAFTRAFEEGAARVVTIGGDAPTLPAELVEEAFANLAAAPVVLTPALDGGYALIAAVPPCPPLFEAMPWGTPDVLDATRRRAREAGVVLRETRAWGDVDTFADLERLEDEIASDPGRAPATAEAIARLRLYLAEDTVL